jgi:predicted MPP superfamily phosphohydrolase
MHPLLLFNIAMAGVVVGILLHHRRYRTAASWWRGAAMGIGASLALVTLFGAAPRVLFHSSHRPSNPFLIMQLIAWILFVHAPACLLGGAFLLRKTARKTAILSLLAGLAAVGVGIDAFLIEPEHLEVTHLEIRSPKLDRPIRLVVVADIQTDHIGDYERRVLERLRAEKPDVVLFAGDYIHAAPDKYTEKSKSLNALIKEIGVEPAKGAYAVEGNVDYGKPWPIVFQNLPVTPLRATSTFPVGPIDLTCLSMRDSFTPDLELPGRNPDRYHVVLGHGPDYALGQIDADLLLSGHTHGGQVQLPILGPITTGCRVPRDWASGLTELASGAKLYVSRGVGMERGSAPRIRFLCRPELVVIDLVPE